MFFVWLLIGSYGIWTWRSLCSLIGVFGAFIELRFGRKGAICSRDDSSCVIIFGYVDFVLDQNVYCCIIIDPGIFSIPSLIIYSTSISSTITDSISAFCILTLKLNSLFFLVSLSEQCCKPPSFKPAPVSFFTSVWNSAIPSPY